MKFKIKLTKQDGSVKWYFPTRKSKIWPTLTHEVWKSAYIKVIYGNDLYNHGTFTTYKDAKQFLDECTEKPLLDYIAGGSW